MASYQFDKIIEGVPDFSNCCYLWIWKPSQIPPHIGISMANEYFSLTVKGKEQKKVDALLKVFGKRKTGLIWVQLNSAVSLSQVEKAFEIYDKAGVGDSTCSSPIFDLFQAPRTVVKVSDLLFFLKASISEVYGKNLPVDFNSLPVYDLEKIRKRINQLSTNLKV